jgi:hypothetical protein
LPGLLKFAAQVADMRTDHLARLGLINGIAAHLAHQLMTGDDASTMSCQIEEQIKLGWGEIDRAVVHGDLIAARIDRQRAEVHNVTDGWLANHLGE